MANVTDIVMGIGCYCCLFSNFNSSFFVWRIPTLCVLNSKWAFPSQWVNVVDIPSKLRNNRVHYNGSLSLVELGMVVSRAFIVRSLMSFVPNGLWATVSRYLPVVKSIFNVYAIKTKLLYHPISLSSIYISI